VLGRFRSALPHVAVTLRIANSTEIERNLVENSRSPRRRRQAPRFRASDPEQTPFLAREAGSATQRYVDRGLIDLARRRAHPPRSR
jgi:hypothetical protein